VFYSTSPTGNQWFLIKHEDALFVLRNADIFRNIDATPFPRDPDDYFYFIPIEIDPPHHRKYRNIVDPLFCPAGVKQLEGQIRQRANDLLDEVEAEHFRTGECEFTTAFGRPLPVSVFLDIMGLPQEMLQQFLEWEEAAFHGTIAERQAAGHAILEYLKRFIAEQKDNPNTELMRGILSANIKDRPLTDAEMLGLYYLLYVAGLDTVFSSLGWIMHHLATDQNLQARLRSNPQDIPAAVEEFTRAYGVSAPSRTVAQDLVFHGVPMKRGEDIRLPTYLAGRDPRAWPNPHVIDIDRKPRHVTFGIGPHVCVGASLAVMQLVVAVAVLAQRFRFRLVPGHPVRRAGTPSERAGARV